MAYKGNGNKTAENVYKRVYNKIPLNRVVPAEQFTSTSEGDVNWDTKLNSSGGIRSSVTRTRRPAPPPYKYHPAS